MASLFSITTWSASAVWASDQRQSQEAIGIINPHTLQSGFSAFPEENYYSPLGSGVETDLSGVVKRAVNWHPSIAGAIGRLYQQNEQVTVARAGYYPQVSAGLSAGYDSSLNGSKNSQSVSLSASQMLYDFGKVSSSVDAASAGVNKNRATVLLAIDTVARDTAQAAIEVQRYQSLLDIAREQIKGVSAIAALAQQRSAMGASSRSDVLQAQSRIEAAQATELQLSAQLNRWQGVLLSLVGSRTPVSLGKTFPVALSDACLNASLDLSMVPEMLVAEAERVEAQALMEQARAEGLPTLSLDPSLRRYLDDRVSDKTEFRVALNVSMPVYQGGSITARQNAAQFALQTAEAARNAAQLTVSQGLLEAREQTNSLGQRLVSLGLREQSISETRDLYRQQYLSLGTRSLLDLLNAEQEIHQAGFDRVNTRHDLHRLQIDCLYNTGALRTAFQLENSKIQGVEVRS
ncbi:TolC family outer membrane protein [Zobellella sp. DQSA1]|uniref:TolC family outer membrane protein n=1 Tax=Zobellella sp. DQSA1 TaxID=3342386 RepID=UPI0035BEE63F